MKNSKGGLQAIDGGKKPDIVTVKIIHRANNAQGFIAFMGACDLNTFEETLEAFDHQGYLDLVDGEATKFRIYREGVINTILVGIKPQATKGLIMPANN